MIPRYLPVALCLLFAAVVIHACFYAPLWFDSAYYATFAKNIASGYGWADSFHEKNWFVGTTSGPLVYLPAALMIGLFGNEIWMPALTAVLCHLFWLSILLFVLHHYFTDQKIFACVVVALLLIFFYFESFWWSALAGELQALLLLLIACVVSLLHFQEERKKYFLLGVLAGLSILAKMIALPGFGGIAIMLLVGVLKQKLARRDCLMSVLSMIWIGIAGMLVVLLPFRLYEAWMIYSQATVSYVDFIKYKWTLYSNTSSMGIVHESGNGMMVELLSKNLQAGVKSITVQLAGYGLSAGTILFVFVSGLLLILASIRKQNSQLTRLMTVMLLPFLCSLFYFLFLMEGIFVRYAMLPILLFFMVLMLAAIRWLSWKGPLLVMACLLLVMPGSRRDMMGQMLFFQPVHFDKDGNNIRLNQLNIEARNYIATHVFSYPLAGCGWLGAPRSLEYLLDTTENFKDCFALIEEALAFDETDYLQRYPEVTALVASGTVASAEAHYRANRSDHTARYVWKYPVNFTLVIDNANWKFARHHAPTALRQKAIMKACMKHIIYQTALFRIMDCPFEALQKQVDLDGSTPFVGAPPIWNKS